MRRVLAMTLAIALMRPCGHDSVGAEGARRCGRSAPQDPRRGVPLRLTRSVGTSVESGCGYIRCVIER